MKTERPRFVFDTNVLVSAFLFRSGTTRQALDRAMQIGELIYSDDTLNELWEVLVRPKFDRYLPLTDRLKVLEGFEQIAHLQQVSLHITLCRDPRDDKFLSLAAAAHAACLISGDGDLLALAGSFAFPILSPADFLLQDEFS